MRALNTLESVYGIGYFGPYRTSATNQLGGIEEHLFIFEDGNALTPELVESFHIDTRGESVTISLKEGIPFNAPRGQESKDFGILTAAEVVEWLNRSNSNTNIESTYGDRDDLAAVLNEAVVVDDFTLEIGLVSAVFFCLPLSQFGCLGHSRGVHKVTTADLFGIEWARAHHVGTGPYVQGNCTPGDRCTIHAVESHWRKVPEVSEITGIQVPATLTQIAMLRNGAIDMAELDYKFLPEVIQPYPFESPFRFLETMPRSFIGQSVIFAGNLWEESHARAGRGLSAWVSPELNPWDSPVYDKDYPWIGDPWQELRPTNVRYSDTNNPPGTTDMEQARLVRLALSTVIDRDAIVRDVLSDLGTPIYSEYMGPEYPGWDPDRATSVWDMHGNQVAAYGTARPVPWELEDGDVAEANRLLALAGYPLEEGKRVGFGMLTVQAYAAEAGPIGLEVAEAIMESWARLGIQIEGLIEDYGGIISPRMRQRIQFLPVLMNGDVNSNILPLDWPLPIIDTSASRPGWGVGFESPAGARWLFEIIEERDPDVRIAKHLDWVDYSLFWVQYAGVFQVPKGIVVSDRIKSWDGRAEHYRNVSSNPEYIKLN